MAQSVRAKHQCLFIYLFFAFSHPFLNQNVEKTTLFVLKVIKKNLFIARITPKTSTYKPSASLSGWKGTLMDRCVSLIRSSQWCLSLTTDTSDIVTLPLMEPL